MDGQHGFDETLFQAIALPFPWRTHVAQCLFGLWSTTSNPSEPHVSRRPRFVLL